MGRPAAAGSGERLHWEQKSHLPWPFLFLGGGGGDNCVWGGGTTLWLDLGWGLGRWSSILLTMGCSSTVE